MVRGRRPPDIDSCEGTDPANAERWCEDSDSDPSDSVSPEADEYGVDGVGIDSSKSHNGSKGMRSVDDGDNGQRESVNLSDDE